jgi:solute carrier family 8 (sodium/calcium exchanger)
MGLSGEDAAKLAAYKSVALQYHLCWLGYIYFDFQILNNRLIMTKNHSHAWYRIGATRVFTGSKKVKPQLSIKLKEV